MSYRYIGNKTRLLPQLLPALRALVAPGARIADLMCGTASVAESLRLHGFQVVASDVMTYAAHHARARLLLDRAPQFCGLGGKRYAEVTHQLNELELQPGFLWREHSPDGQPEGGHAPRGYFTARNAAKLDAINAQLRAWESHKRISDLESALLRHDLVLAANTVANIAGTYGHFRSTWSQATQRDVALVPSQFIANYRTDHTVLQGRAEDLAPDVEADLCYLDPPYMKRQYAANYHLLETLARGDSPDAVGVSGLRPWRDQYSDFCSKVKIRGAFAAIIEPMKCDQFLISYSEDGLLSLDELRELLERWGHVEIQTFRYPRFRSNNSELGSHVTEYLFHLQRSKS